MRLVLALLSCSAAVLAQGFPCAGGAANHLPLGVGCPVLPLTLTAWPPPVSTPAAGTLVTHSVVNVPILGGGLGVTLLLIAFQPPLAPPVDLGFLGAPGCSLHVSNPIGVSVQVGPAGLAAVHFHVLAIPAGLAPTAYVTQVAALTPQIAPPGPLGNPAGIFTSNGVCSWVNAF